MSKLIRLEKLNVVKYSNNEVKIQSLKEEGFKVVEDIERPKTLPEKELEEIMEDEVTEDDTQEEILEDVTYKYDDMTIEQIKNALNEKGIGYKAKDSKEVLFSLLV